MRVPRAAVVVVAMVIAAEAVEAEAAQAGVAQEVALAVFASGCALDFACNLAC